MGIDKLALPWIPVAREVHVSFNQVIEAIGRGVDVAGIAAIAGGITLAVLLSMGRLFRRQSDVYRRFRQDVGRAILLGLELLVAADIIRTVAISPTLVSVAVLAGIVLVRTFLSFSLEVELTGSWPWQRRPPSADVAARAERSEQPGPTLP
jgi:uncharacterized membrane protein